MKNLIEFLCIVFTGTITAMFIIAAVVHATDYLKQFFGDIKKVIKEKISIWKVKTAKKWLAEKDIDEIITQNQKKEIVIQYLQDNGMIVHRRAEQSEVMEC